MDLPNEALSGVERQLLVDRVYDSSAVANEARWRLFLSQDANPQPGRVFDRDQLLMRAQHRPANNQYGTVSNFTEWIYGLYGLRKKHDALRRGIEAEALIDKARIASPKNADWELVHCGINVPTLSRKFPRIEYTVTPLSIRGCPLRANPDYVFRAKRANASGDLYVIVEVKHTAAPIPPNLWPNVRAQLWAYSEIDQFASAAEVYLVGEVWGGSRSAGLRRSVSWTRSGGLLNVEATQLFAAYRESVESTSRTTSNT